MNVVVFDIETTGTDVDTDEIIQIGAVIHNIEGNRSMLAFEVKILPTEKGAAGLARMEAEGFKNSYDAEVWAKTGIPCALAMQRFAGWVRRAATEKRISKGGKPYYVALGAGYNAARFDHPFVLRVCRAHDIFLPMDMRCWDVMQFALLVLTAQGKEPPDWKLGTVCQALNINLDNAHDALADVKATAELLCKCFKAVR